MKNNAETAVFRKKILPYYFLVPLIAVVMLFILFPAAGTFFTSLFRDVTFLEAKFNFPANYTRVFSDSGFLQAARFTLLFVLVSVIIEMAAGILLAVLLNESIPGRGFLRVSVLIPWAIPVAVSGRVWELIYNYSYGLANFFLAGTGLAGGPINWLGSEAGAFFALVTADAWKTVPFVAIIILAGLQSIPGELYEQAKTDGAGIFKRFYYITLPVLKPVIIVALLFRTIDALRVFDVIFVITGGGPGGATNSLSVYAYKYFLSGDFGTGSAVSVVLFLIALVLSLFYIYAGKFSEGLK